MENEEVVKVEVEIPPSETPETEVIVIAPETEPEAIKEDEKLDKELIILIGELKGKIEHLEKTISKIEEHANVLSDHSNRITELEKKPEPEIIAEEVTPELPEVEIPEEIPEEIQAEVIRRNRFFL